MSRTHKDIPPSLLHESTPEKKPRNMDTTWKWWKQTPSWWTNLYMTRPQRQQAHAWENMARKTALEDLEEIDVPNVSKKPHKYYW